MQPDLPNLDGMFFVKPVWRKLTGGEFYADEVYRTELGPFVIDTWKRDRVTDFWVWASTLPDQGPFSDEKLYTTREEAAHVALLDARVRWINDAVKPHTPQ